MVAVLAREQPCQAPTMLLVTVSIELRGRSASVRYREPAETVPVVISADVWGKRSSRLAGGLRVLNTDISRERRRRPGGPPH